VKVGRAPISVQVLVVDETLLAGSVRASAWTGTRELTR